MLGTYADAAAAGQALSDALARHHVVTVASGVRGSVHKRYVFAKLQDGQEVCAELSISWGPAPRVSVSAKVPRNSGAAGTTWSAELQHALGPLVDFS